MNNEGYLPFNIEIQAKSAEGFDQISCGDVDYLTLTPIPWVEENGLKQEYLLKCQMDETEDGKRVWKMDDDDVLDLAFNSHIDSTSSENE